MRVKCISTYPNEEQITNLGPKFNPTTGRFYGLHVGKEYVVIGLKYWHQLGNSIFVYIYCPYYENDNSYGYILVVPICVFEITDSRPSKYWTAILSENCSFTMLPEELNRIDYFLDRYSDGEPELVEKFYNVYLLLEQE